MFQIESDSPVVCDPEPISEAHGGIADIDEVLSEVFSAVPPLWPLKDYVAVNPFVGLTSHSFLSARQALRRVREADILISESYLKQYASMAGITLKDIELARDRVRSEYPALCAEVAEPDFQNWPTETHAEQSDEHSQRLYWTFAEALDQSNGTNWATTITHEISRHCATHYDEGQSVWSSPWKHLPLFHAWREITQLDLRIEKLGVSGFRRFVASLPSTPREAVEFLLQRLGVPPKHCAEFLLAQLFSVAGWSSYVQYRVRETELSGDNKEDLIGLLAIRLAYDCCLKSSLYPTAEFTLWPDEKIDRECYLATGEMSNYKTRLRYTMQAAAETAYRRQLCTALSKTADSSKESTQRKLAQMVFCIDVRSEVIRRHLEASSSDIETLGFAGFFGLALEYIPLGLKDGVAQCPVLLKPALQIRENILGADKLTQSKVLGQRITQRILQGVWQSFQSSASTCFSFVESLGLLYAGKLLWRSASVVGLAGRSSKDDQQPKTRPQLGPDLEPCGNHGIGSEKRVDLAQSILTNLGLIQDYARIVVLCGHASDTVNNPYKASFDCGACGGHSGEPNARVAAALLNDCEVRCRLKERGIEIPDDVWFVPAVHHTTTDEIQFLDLESLPSSHIDEFHDLVNATQTACILTRAERAQRMGEISSGDLLRRSRDWSEVRPEWGLAGNAAFIVAPRSRTKGLNLEGRTFLHNYEFRQDDNLKVLELIMTAPMIVTSWINLQYYASTVDNRAYGSGNKVIHNVVGQLGILQGNGGDLMTGLPWQSLHDGQKYQHQPLRLLVMIEAPRSSLETIIERHETVRHLIENGWISLVSIEGDCFYRRSARSQWQAETFTCPEDAELRSMLSVGA